MIHRLRVNLFQNPIGLGDPTPEFSWEFAAPLSGENRQIAYHLIVSVSESKIKSGTGEIWDSGKVESSQTTFIRFKGQVLKSRMQCFWKVYAWCESGERLESEVATWTMGLLENRDWKAKWIGFESPPQFPTDGLLGAKWIWDDGRAPGTVDFEKNFVIPEAGTGILWGIADDEAEVIINGAPLGQLQRAQVEPHPFPLSGTLTLPHLPKGENTIRVRAKKRHVRDSYAGVILRLLVSGRTEITTNSSWQSRRDGKASRVLELGSFGIPPWQHQSIREYPNLSARYLRREFLVQPNLKRATLYFSGLGLSEAWINGCRVGTEVLSPHITDYHQRVYYRTFDATEFLQEGKNAIGGILGNGRFFAPRVNIPCQMENYGPPKLLLQLEMEYRDGRIEQLLSGEDWKVTCDGAIGWNNEFDGEYYDSRKDNSAWCQAGFDDKAWNRAKMVKAPRGKIIAQTSNPIRITEVIPIKEIRKTKYGTLLCDFGVNLVGWCRGTLEGTAGSIVTLHHAESLETEDILATENLRSALCTDTIILSEGLTQFEPKFTYHGFRYLELRGPCNLKKIEACFVHDDVESTGSFSCSNHLVTRIVEAAKRGIRGNYRSIPTDCPQRDERMGWLGDRAGGVAGEAFLFEVSKFYRKWLEDIRLAQGVNGSLPDIAPPFWKMYSDNVVWPSCLLFIPHWLHRHYGDVRAIEDNFDSISRWLAHLEGYVQEGLISRDTYGDWCVPPESPHLIHSQRPDLKTSPVVLATSYFAKNLELAAGFADLIGRKNLAEQWRVKRREIKAAFNAKFFNPSNGSYDNGSQTASLLALAFDLVSREYQMRCFEFLVSRITETGQPTLGTGLVGGQWLLRTLTAFGRPDIARALVTREEYPGWGYMLSQGATTIWELWNGDSAEPIMNSGNHVMLLGDLVSWIYEDVAGIQPASAGFETIRFRPHFLFEEVSCSYHSIRGPIRSSWKASDGTILWEIEVPPNTSAVIELPESIAPSLKLNGLTPEITAITEAFVPRIQVSVPPGKHSISCASVEYRLPFRHSLKDSAVR